MNAKKILDDCVDEMYFMEKGALIGRPDEIILECGDGYVTRRQIKHIIEQRIADGKSPEGVKQILARIPAAIIQPDFEILNPNQRYPESILRIKVFRDWGYGIVVVMDKDRNRQRDLITAYQYRLMDTYFLLLKKLNASAAGKTPSP